MAQFNNMTARASQKEFIVC